MAQRWRPLEVRDVEQTPRRWRVPLREDVLAAFLAGDDGTAAGGVFAAGSLFSPMLFGSFFDPADAFPLWDFDPEALLPAPPRSAGVSWSESPAEYLLTAALPEAARDGLAVAADDGRVIEVSGMWRGRRGRRDDWRTGEWWEVGFVRRLELPEDARPAMAAARVEDGGGATTLVIKIPRSSSQEAALVVERQ